MNRVLVVENDPQLRDQVSTILAEAGFSAEGAESGAEALDRLTRSRFDLVVLDAGLPRLNGLAVWEHFRDLDPPPRTIMIIGDDTPEAVLRTAGALACRYVTKPVSPRVLTELVTEVLTIPASCPPLEVLSARPEWVELLVPCTIEAAERSESFLEVMQTGIAPEVAERVSKAVHELMLNAVEWGGKLDPGRKVRVACVRTSRFVLYRIADPGPGFQFDALTHTALSNPPDQPAEHQRIRADKGLRPGGFGILMARALVDELIYNETQNEVILVKYLDDPHLSLPPQRPQG